MKRRRAREYALQLLFQLNLTGDELSEEVLRDFWEGINEEPDVKDFTYSIVTGTREHIEVIDKIINKAAEHWSMDRMAVVDRNILRAAADIPPSVSINEAIEIAKKYSTEESASFINGILDKIQKSKVE
jgi:N utilization substance protein B